MGNVVHEKTVGRFKGAEREKRDIYKKYVKKVSESLGNKDLEKKPRPV
jgi:hypothetical protein